MGQITIGFQFKVGGVLTDATSAKLSNEEGTAGVIRNDTGAVVVADGTDFNHDGTGLYSYTFTEPDVGLEYTYYIEVVYGGATYRSTQDVTGTAAPATGTTEATTVTPWLTFSDMMEHLEDFVQGLGRGVPKTARRRAVLSAYDELVEAHDWSFLRGVLRIQTYAAQTTGSVAYDNSSRVVTFTGATVPTWADGNGGAMYLDDVLCEIEDRLSSTTVRLSSNRNPGGDLAAGTSYTLFKLWYALPADFLALDDPMTESFYHLGRHIPWSEMQYMHRSVQETGEMNYWSIGPNPNGGFALWTHAALSTAIRLDAPYKKRARELKITGLESGHYAGTISVSGTQVTGSSTSFTSDMAGSVLRVASGSIAPGGLASDNPFAEERLISAYTDATTLTLAASGTTVNDKAYRISDPLSVGRVAWNAVKKGAEAYLARLVSAPNAGQFWMAYRAALNSAKAADAVERPRRVAGTAGLRRAKLGDLYIPDPV